LTSPGKAKDVRSSPLHSIHLPSQKSLQHIRRSSQPGLPGRLSHQTWDSSNIAGRSYENMHPTVDLSRQATITEPPPSALSNKSYGRQRDFHAPLDKQNLARHESRPSYSSRNEPDTGTPQNSTTHMVNNNKSRHAQKRTRTASPPDLPPPQHSRRPPTTPVLLPEYRYCHRDELLKPPRAHHCRACGTVCFLQDTRYSYCSRLALLKCIMKYDHHCPCGSPQCSSVPALIMHI
jgi:palmitoyltransferase